jgi:hypothetical protein
MMLTLLLGEPCRESSTRHAAQPWLRQTRSKPGQHFSIEAIPLMAFATIENQMTRYNGRKLVRSHKHGKALEGVPFRIDRLPRRGARLWRSSVLSIGGSHV